MLRHPPFNCKDEAYITLFTFNDFRIINSSNDNFVIINSSSSIGNIVKCSCGYHSFLVDVVINRLDANVETVIKKCNNITHIILSIFIITEFILFVVYLNIKHNRNIL